MNKCRATGLLFCAALLLRCADYELLDDQERVPEPVTLGVIAATDSSVTIRWSSYRDDDFGKYAVYYGTRDIVDRSDRLADSLMFAVDTVKVIAPLDEQTRYYFRVIVYNRTGNFSPSNIVDTVTGENLRGKLKLAAPVADNDGAVRLRWTAATEQIDRYVIHADTTSVVDTGDTLVATVYSDTTRTISGLLQNRTWWFRVYAFRENKITATSNSAAITLSTQP